FDVQTAVPSTESVYIKASARDMMYRINARTISGKMPISVTVGVPYVLKWSDEEGNELEETGVSEAGTVIYRDYSYIHLDSLEVYFLDNILIANPAVDPEQTRLTPEDAGVVFPDVSEPVVYGSAVPAFGGNIDYPEGFSQYILSQDTIVVEGDTNKPPIPLVTPEEAYWTAESSVGKLVCRNDEFKCDSLDVLGTSGWHEYGSGSLSIEMRWPNIVEFDTSQMFGPDHIMIPAAQRNGLYRTTTRLVKYRIAVSYGTFGVPYDALIEVNHVRVYTPVFGEAFIEECNSADPNHMYFQETGKKPSDAFILINGRSDSLGADGHEHDTEDFYIRIVNTGSHPVYTGKLGSMYNYSVNKNGRNGGTYIEGNYLRFPFDVYMDVGNDRLPGNDRLIAKNVWVKCPEFQRFYLTENIPGGYYDIEYETVAVNAYGTDERGDTIPYRTNGSADEYIAGNKMKVYISGKLYGLTLIDISSKTEWKNVFSVNNVNKYINLMPEVVYGRSWPANDGTLKKSSISGNYNGNDIESLLFYYTAGTKNELGRSTGRHERYTFPLVYGSHPDRSKSNKGVLKSGYRWRFRLKTTGYAMGLSGSRVTVNASFRIVSGEDAGYDAALYVPDGRGKLKKMTSTIEAEKVMTTSSGIQIWDFEFLIPDGYRIVPEGKTFSAYGKTYNDAEAYSADMGLLDLQDPVWTEDGLMVVNFTIETTSPDGKKLYSYNTANGACNMWKTEGQDINKADFYTKRYSYEYGDIALVSIEKGASSDYVTDHQN
ncbi:MAG: hypothetical protein J6Y89_10345, partial [Lachnospiraceae bacterium]|nr:hypothetical protein [Lachnospiraceae bacterium]